MANNGIAVLQEVCIGRFDYDTASRYSSIITASVIVLGFVSILVLLAVSAVKRKKAPAEIGCFGRVCEPDLSYAERPVSRGAKIPIFFSSTNTIFTFWVFASMQAFAVLYFVVGLIYVFIFRA